MSRSRCALSVCVAMMFAGCVGSNGTSPQPNAAVPSTRYNNGEPNSRGKLNGGTFSADYSGTYRSSIYPCDLGEPKGHLRFHGAGRANFLRRGTETGHLTISGEIGFCFTNGAVTLTSAKDPADTITARVGLGHNEAPCHTLLSYKVKRGTGKFANASGSGTINLHCVGSSAYSDQWSGTLYY